MMTVTIQVTSTLQTMNQWKLYFTFLMVFTEQECVNSLSTLFRMGGGGSAKRFPDSFPQHFWLLVLFIFPHSCKISGPYLVPVSNYWTWAKTTPQKIGFSGQIRVKLSYDNFFHKRAKLTKIWLHDHIYYMVWTTW